MLTDVDIDEHINKVTGILPPNHWRVANALIQAIKYQVLPGHFKKRNLITLYLYN